MPTSHAAQISKIIDLILTANPQSVLDIGVGFGKYGFLCREYLELWDGRNQYNDWQRRIDGIEICDEYLTPVHRYIYDTIYTGNALELTEEIRTYYDLVLLVDVIEHFTVDEGNRLLEQISRKSKSCLISTPFDATDQHEVFENPYEEHKSEWSEEMLYRFDNKIIIPDSGSLIAYARFDEVRVGLQVNA